MSDHFSNLTDTELLAALLACEDAIDLTSRILSDCGGLHGLMRIDRQDLQQIEGLNNSAIVQLLTITELCRRMLSYRADERPIVNSTMDAARLVADMTYLRQEHVRVILLDLTQRVVAIPTIYIGTLNASVLRTAEIFREAVIRNCPAVILVHNHPSGDSSPSPEDVELTHALIAAARLLDITLVDHLIISQHGWSSLKEMGLAFNQPG